MVFCCCSTSRVSIKVIDDYLTTAFIQVFTRFSCDAGFPKRLLHDYTRLLQDVKVEFEICPVQGYNMHGKVERDQINKFIIGETHT